MIKICGILYRIHLFVLLLVISNCSTNDDEVIIVPETGYEWPDNNRVYWPTEVWQTASMTDHNIDPAKMEIANQFAEDDQLARALLVVKDGYIVFENYYGKGGYDKSTNLWSVTKSFSSALVGFLYDDNNFNDPNQLMTDLLPQYPEFNTITLHNVLSMATGLSWNEEGPLWVQWIFSDDWVLEALNRGQIYEPGTRFKYSSGNTHFLTSLIHYRTNSSVGFLAKERLFDPLGIEFNPLTELITYNRWEEYIEPLPQSWRQDTRGIECASFSLYLTARDMAKFGYLYLNKGRWEDSQILSEEWVELSTKDHMTNIYGRYSYGYQWYLTLVDGKPTFLASGFGGQIIGVVPSLDLLVVLKYEAENPVHPVPGTAHDDMKLFELVVEAVKKL